MPVRRYLVIPLLVSSMSFAQKSIAVAPTSLPPQTTLPIVFTQSVSADHSLVGDVVLARTTQVVRLPDGTVLPAGSKVVGHVVAASAFSYDRTPYAKQKPSQLAIRFDSVETGSSTLPLQVTVRAVASPIATNDAYSPVSSDYDSLSPTTQVGGDQLIRSQNEVRDPNGDVVAYNRRDGVYAHLIANGPCDASRVEVSVDHFSATACGLYGFAGVTARSLGSVSAPSELALTSIHGSPELWKHTTALLEVLPEPLR